MAEYASSPGEDHSMSGPLTGRTPSHRRYAAVVPSPLALLIRPTVPRRGPRHHQLHVWSSKHVLALESPGSAGSSSRHHHLRERLGLQALWHTLPTLVHRGAPAPQRDLRRPVRHLLYDRLSDDPDPAPAHLCSGLSRLLDRKSIKPPPCGGSAGDAASEAGLRQPHRRDSVL